MTEVAFHLNVDDCIGYACRLLRKAYARQVRTWVALPPPELAELDRALWLISQNAFLAHCRDTSSSHVRSRSPVVLSTGADAPADFEVLVSLQGSLSASPAAFGRVIEIVGASAEQKDGARVRWRQYRSWGMEPVVAADLARS